MAIAAVGAAASAVSSAAASAATFAAANAGWMALAGTAVSYYSQSQQAKAQAEAQEAYNKRVQEEAIRQYGELSDEEQDTLYDSHKNSLQAQKEFMQARSSIELQSAATGTYGQTVDVAIQDLNTGLGQRTADIVYRRDANLDRINQTAERIRTSADANFDRTPIQEPSIFKAMSDGIRTGQAVSSLGKRVSTAQKEAKRRS